MSLNSAVQSSMSGATETLPAGISTENQSDKSGAEYQTGPPSKRLRPRVVTLATLAAEVSKDIRSKGKPRPFEHDILRACGWQR